LKKVRSPFLLFRRGNTYYAKFWSEDTQTYSIVRSTGILDDGKSSSAIAASREAERMLREGLLALERSDEQTLKFLERWWAQESRPLSQRYRKDNLKRIQRLSESPLKNIKLKDLRNEQLNRLVSWMLEQGVGTRSAQMILQAVLIPLRDAREDGYISFDPKVKKIPHKTRERGALSLEEVRRLLDFSIEKTDDPRVYLGVLLGALCGLRRSEALGLRWEDIDVERGLLQVRRAYTVVDGEKEPKTKGSRRTIELIHPLREKLIQYQEWSPCKENTHYVLFGIPEGSRVQKESNFPRRWRPRGTIPMAADRLTSGFWDVLNRIGISREEGQKRKLSFHSLRHTFITLLVERVGAVPAMLLTGHTKLTTLQRYSHPDRDIAVRGLRKIETDLITG